jgi:tol-pal system protein YbgF
MATKIIKTIAICAVAALALSVAGCSTNKFVMRWTGVSEAQDTVRTDIAAMQSKIIEEQNKLLAEQAKLLADQKMIIDMLMPMRAEQGVRFNEIDRKVSAIMSNMFESQSRLSRLDQKTSEVSRRLEQKLASEEEASNQRTLQLEKLFEIAMGDFNSGRYDLAITGFADLARQYPDAAQVPDAVYWIAEAHFAKKDYATAEKSYMDFVKKYPDGQKSCVAFYKLGLAYEHQEKVQSRDMVWKQLLSRCPDRQEAQSVKVQQEKK